MANDKTNAVRILERTDYIFSVHSYDWDGKTAPDGLSVANSMGQDPGQVFKTLVARGASGSYYVFDIPVMNSLDLKKAARSVGEKSISMIHLKELFPLTGYVHGGCSPIGMKKQFPTVIDETCILYDSIYVSAGRIGLQVEISPNDLLELINGITADIIFEDN